MKDQESVFASSKSKTPWVFIIAFVLIGIFTLAALVLVPFALDSIAYNQGHQAYLQADCANALPKFEKITSKNRLFDIGNISSNAKQEETECKKFQTAFEQEKQNEFGLAIVGFMDVVFQYPDSPLLVASKQHINDIFSVAEPADLANMDTCSRTDDLHNLVVTQVNASDIWAPFYWGCIQILEEGNQFQEALKHYQALLTEFPKHALSENAESALYNNPAACEQLDQIESTSVAVWPEFLPRLISHCRCADSLGCVVLGPTEPIHIAYMLTVSGWTSFLGEDSKGAIEIAIDDRNSKLLNHDILLTGEDTLCSAEGGRDAATKVANDHTILGVIGTNCASSATAAIPTISHSGLVMLSPSNTAPALTIERQSWQPGYFRITHSDLLQGKFAADFAFYELGARTAATIHDGSPYADQLQQIFAIRFQELGGTVIFQGGVQVGTTDMHTLLTSAGANSPDVLYLPIFEPEGPFVVAQSSEVTGLEDTVLISADGLLSTSFPENTGPNVVGMYISGPYVSNPGYDEFLSKWEAKFGSFPPSGFHAHAYDGTNILLDAIEEVASADNNNILLIGRQAIRDAITETTYFTGLTGNLDCSGDNYSKLGITNPSHGDCSTGESLGIYQITQSELDGNWPPPVVYTANSYTLLDEIKGRGYILVSTDPNYEPMSFLNTKGRRIDDTKCPLNTLTIGEMQGFDVDVAAAIGDRMGVETCFATPSWDVVTSGNWDDKWDVSIGSMTITTARQEVLNFSVPYYYAPAVIATNKNAQLNSIKNLTGQTICVGTSTTFEIWLNKGYLGLPLSSIYEHPPTDITVVSKNTDQECALALVDGRDDFSAYVTPQVTLNANIASGLPLKQLGSPVFSEEIAAAFDKLSTLSTSLLRSEINNILMEMHNDGTLTDFSMKWFGVDITQKPK